jgi:hypothetical protein
MPLVGVSITVRRHRWWRRSASRGAMIFVFHFAIVIVITIFVFVFVLLLLLLSSGSERHAK